MPLQATSGAASQDAFGGNGVAVVPTYIEDVFSTYLYTGTGAALTITNNIDLSTKGGLTWIKGRSGATGHRLTDTARGVTKSLESNSTAAEATESTGLTAFGTTGFTIGADADYNTSAATYASWTFREQPKFFDIVTYTGDGTSSRAIPHNLGSVPGCIIVKSISLGLGWSTYHRGMATSNPESWEMYLNTTAARTVNGTWGGAPTSTNFYVNNLAAVNQGGDSYVAYLFAHDAGGFGLTGTDNVISCGSFTTDGSGNATISLGYEPQWLLVKQSSGGTTYWRIWDTMRGWSVSTGGGSTADLYPNDSAAENFGGTNGNGGFPTATGFYANGGVFNASQTHIYIAIRRGPMKVPTDATKVFAPIAKTGDGSTTTVTNVGFPADLFMFKWRSLAYGWKQQDRLRGFPQQLASDATSTESNSGTYTFGTVNNTGYTYGANASTSGELNGSGVTSSVLAFGRAPSFMDVVCYTGTGSATTFSHNLQAVPELMIVKERNGANGWQVYSASLTNTDYLILNTTAGTASSATRWNSTTPTSTVFSVGTHGATNGSGQNFVNYLFATCAGVSKVGSYTGTATTKQIDCGFTGGARFVLIKRTDSTGDWYVWDTARGIVSGNDPYLLLNSTAAEVTNTDYIDTYSAGFEISSTAPAAINASGGTYIFLAIA